VYYKSRHVEDAGYTTTDGIERAEYDISAAEIAFTAGGITYRGRICTAVSEEGYYKREFVLSGTLDKIGGK